MKFARLCRKPVVIETDEAQEFYRSLRDVELPDAAVKMQLSVLPRELPSCLGSFNSHFRAHVVRESHGRV